MSWLYLEGVVSQSTTRCRLKYLKNYWMDCHEGFYNIHRLDKNMKQLIRNKISSSVDNEIIIRCDPHLLCVFIRNPARAHPALCCLFSFSGSSYRTEKEKKTGLIRLFDHIHRGFL